MLPNLEYTFKSYLVDSVLSFFSLYKYKSIHKINCLANIGALYEQWVRSKKNLKDEKENKLAYLYLKYLQKQTSNIRTINRALQPLRLYYRFFRKENPFQYLYVKNTNKRVRNNFFTKEELTEMYTTHPQQTITQKRAKVILGLYVFNGIKSSEIKNVERKDIDLSKCTILLKGDNRTNRRRISLDIQQLLLLNEYMNLTAEERTTDLIKVGKGKNALQNVLQSLAEILRKEVYGFEGLYQLRASLINNWTKDYDLRKVQYLSGHRYISSTEKFIVHTVEGLTKEVNKYFPLDE